MPPLITATADEPALVAVTSKGYSITRAGLKELERRGIPHQGDAAMILDIPPLDWGDYDPVDMGYGQQAKPQAEPKGGLWLPPFMRKRT
jgi:hypothetical protein